MSGAAVHASLATLLRCLDRPDVVTLELASGDLVKAVRATGTVPLTKTPLSAAQIEGLLVGTSVALALAANNGTPEAITVLLGERPCRVVVQKTSGRVHIAIGHAAHEATGPAAIPAAVPAAAVELVPSVSMQGIDLSSSERPPLGAAAPPAPAPTVPPAAFAEGQGIDLGFELSSKVTAPVRHKPIAVAAAPKPDPVPQQAASIASAPRAASHGYAVQQLTDWVLLARQMQGSDIHLTPEEPLRVRRSGALASADAVVKAELLDDLVSQMLSPQQQARLADLGYVDLAADLGAAGRVRINVSRRPSGCKWCLRLVPLTVPTLQGLHLPEDLNAVANYHQGLAIVSGPSGHGKTATLAALIDRINQHSSHHIILIEDPIEVVHPVRSALISQREVGSHTQSYARALKAALREDPDVIVVGELRDKETVEIALGAAETGHLVLATMNTRSAAKTIDRLIDLFPPEDQAQVRSTLAGSLKMVISQRLVPTVSGGQMPAVELLTGSVPLWALIRDNKLFQLPSLQQRGRSAGMIRLDSSLLELVQAGHVQAQVARSFAENPQEFDRVLGAAKPGPISSTQGRP